MFRNILIPVDFTEKNERALDVARELATAGGAQVTLLHVIETLADTPFEEEREFYKRLEERSEAAMARFGERLAVAGLSARREIVYGRRTDEIVRFAEARAADLIVLSSHRVAGEHPGEGWVTISHRVAVLAPCPVLLVK